MQNQIIINTLRADTEGVLSAVRFDAYIIPQTITPIIKLTEACNYSCSFCRYANHPQANSLLTPEEVEGIISKTVKYNLSRGEHRVKLIFHGGEPLLWGHERFQRIMRYEEMLAKDHSIHFSNSIQTNGFLLDAQWVALFKKHSFSVGISMDGPNNLNSHFGKFGNEMSVNKVLKNIDLLKAEKVPFGILCVITDAHTTRAQEFYDFWVNAGIDSIGLCFCYNPEDGATVDCANLSKFLIELFNLYFNGKAKLNIREFNNAIQKKLTHKAETCTCSCRESCGHFLTIDSHMRVMFCDDYDLNKSGALGILSDSDFEEIIGTAQYQAMCQQSRAIVGSMCSTCTAYNFCGSGCNRNDTTNGNYFCPTYKEVYAYIEQCLHQNGIC